MYVTDHVNWRVREFSPSGQFLRQWGHREAGPGEFIGISGIALDRQGYVYVCESDMSQMPKFTADGKPITLWWLPRFNHPVHVAVDAQDNLYVANAYRNSVLKRPPLGKALAERK